MGACIIGCGKSLPGLVVKNEDLEHVVQTSDEWIVSRTGIHSRRIAVKETALDLAHAASCQAIGAPTPQLLDEVDIEPSGKCLKPIAPEDIDLIVLTTVTPDLIVPCNAAALKKRLGATNAVAFDMNAACSGFVYGLSVVESMMAASNMRCGSSSTNTEDGSSGTDTGGCSSDTDMKTSSATSHANAAPIRHALLVSAERLSRITDWQDRNTCVLFGDGAGAMLLEWSDDSNSVLSIFLENTDDDGNSLTCINSYTSPFPFDSDGAVCDQAAIEKHWEDNPDPKTVDYSYINGLDVDADPAKSRILEEFDISEKSAEGGPDQSLYMNGQKVFKFASRAMEKAVREAASLAGIEVEDIDLVVPHQANLRIIEYASKRLGLPLDKFQISIATTGNSSSSCLPMALTDAFVEGRISKGSIVCIVAFGGGLTAGASVLKF